MDEDPANLLGPDVPGFELVQLVGTGGSATVYKAWDRSVQRHAAVKVLHRQITSDRDRKLFEQEVVALGRVGSHPHAVTIFGSGVTAAGQPYLVMEFADRGTLADRLKVGPKVPTAELIELAINVGSAVATAHQRSVLHGDLKPSNVLIGEFNNALLSDFGVARVADLDLTAPTDVGHTVLFAAPEILDGDGPDELCDIYSFGATLFAAANGRAAYAATTTAGIIRAVSEATEPPDCDPSVPPCLAQIIRSCMAPDQRERPSTMAAVLSELQACQSELGLEATPLTIRSADIDEVEQPPVAVRRADEATLVPEVAEPHRKMPVVAGAVLGLGVVVAALTIWVSNRGPDETADPATTVVPTTAALVDDEPEDAGLGLVVGAVSPLTDGAVAVDCPNDGEWLAGSQVSTIEEPADLVGRVLISGAASSSEGVRHVEAALVATDGSDDLYWNPRDQVWLSRFHVFEIPVSQLGANDTTWTLDQPLPAGEYLLWVWTRALSGGGEDRDVTKTFVVEEPTAPGDAVEEMRRLLDAPVVGERGPASAPIVRIDVPRHGDLVAERFRLGASTRNGPAAETMALSLTDSEDRWWDFASQTWGAERVEAMSTTGECATMIDAPPGAYTAIVIGRSASGESLTRINEFGVFGG